MREHAHNMKVMANVKAFEEYRRLIRDFKYRIEVQNEAIENQTRAAAMQEGFVEMGDVFVKQGALSGQVYVANAYTWYDVESAIDRHLMSFGFTPKSNDEMFKFLEDADNVEVESYFYTQKLAVQATFEKIVGTGDDDVRQISRDEKDIGEFGMWAGRRPGANRESGDAFDQEELRRYAQHYEPEMLMQSPELLSQLELFAFPGFGELGVYGQRPGGAVLGFYPQLKIAGMLSGKAESKELNKLAGGVDPISTMVNQFNPIVFTANSIKNVEMATRFQTGKSASYMWEAQVLAGIKQPVVAVGNAMTTVGTALLFTGGLSWAGALLLIGGIALNALGNSMQVNPTTGERATKMTDQAAVNTGIGTVTSVLGGLSIGASSVASSASASAEAAKGTADAARLATMAQSAAETANTIQQGSQLVNLMSSVAQAGMQYDAKGNSQGWSLSGMSGDRFATQTGIGLLADGLAGGMTSTGFSSAAFSGGANGVLSATMSQSMNVAVEYHKFKTGAKDQQYTGMVNAGWEGMWNGAYGSAVSAYAGQLATSYSQQNALNNSAWGLDAMHLPRSNNH